MKTMKMWILSILVWMFATGLHIANAQDRETQKNIETSLKILQKALNKHNYGLVEKQFDDEFTYGDFGCGGGCSSSKSIAGMIISSYPHKVEKITINHIVADGPDYKVLTTFSLRGSNNTDQEMLISADGKFLEMELPGIKLMMQGQGDSGCGNGDGC